MAVENKVLKMIMMAGTVRIMHQNVAHDWQMLTVSIVDTTIWVAQVLEGRFAAAVHRLNTDITVQGLCGCGGSAVLAALSAYLPPAEHMMHLSNAGLCVQDKLQSVADMSQLAKKVQVAACPADNMLQCIGAQEITSCITQSVNAMTCSHIDYVVSYDDEQLEC